MLEGDPAPPYWAYCWAGGAALARHLDVFPHVVAGKSVLDLGAGSGLVAIAAARAGASRVTAAEINRHGLAAIGLNAALNGVVVETIAGDVMAGPVPDAEVILAGDVFYAPDVAARAEDFLRRSVAAGRTVLVGDPGRVDLPLERMSLIAEYPVTDFGDSPHGPKRSGRVYALT